MIYNVINNNNSTVTLEIAVPGFNKDTLKASIEEGYLIVSSTQDREIKGFKYLVQDIPTSYLEKIYVGDSLKVEDAACSEGILTVLFSKQNIGIQIK
jgi:HSP20 family molecular chaperone IbpA